jgi:hypothetical protein
MSAATRTKRWPSGGMPRRSTMSPGASYHTTSRGKRRPMRHFFACPGGMQPLCFLARPGGSRRRGSARRNIRAPLAVAVGEVRGDAWRARGAIGAMFALALPGLASIALVRAPVVGTLFTPARASALVCALVSLVLRATAIGLAALDALGLATAGPVGLVGEGGAGHEGGEDQAWSGLAPDVGEHCSSSPEERTPARRIAAP